MRRPRPSPSPDEAPALSPADGTLTPEHRRPPPLQAPQEAPQAPGTVTRTLARPIVHEGALRRPGERVTLPAAVAAVLEPEDHFEPLTPDPQET